MDNNNEYQEEPVEVQASVVTFKDEKGKSKHLKLVKGEYVHTGNMHYTRTVNGVIKRNIAKDVRAVMHGTRRKGR